MMVISNFTPNNKILSIIARKPWFLVSKSFTPLQTKFWFQINFVIHWCSRQAEFKPHHPASFTLLCYPTVYLPSLFPTCQACSSSLAKNIIFCHLRINHISDWIPTWSHDYAPLLFSSIFSFSKMILSLWSTLCSKKVCFINLCFKYRAKCTALVILCCRFKAASFTQLYSGWCHP